MNNKEKISELLTEYVDIVIATTKKGDKSFEMGNYNAPFDRLLVRIRVIESLNKFIADEIAKAKGEGVGMFYDYLDRHLEIHDTMTRAEAFKLYEDYKQ